MERKSLENLQAQNADDYTQWQVKNEGTGRTILKCIVAKIVPHYN